MSPAPHVLLPSGRPTRRDNRRRRHPMGTAAATGMAVCAEPCGCRDLFVVGLGSASPLHASHSPPSCDAMTTDVAIFLGRADGQPACPPAHSELQPCPIGRAGGRLRGESRRAFLVEGGGRMRTKRKGITTTWALGGPDEVLRPFVNPEKRFRGSAFPVNLGCGASGFLSMGTSAARVGWVLRCSSMCFICSAFFFFPLLHARNGLSYM
jgi:hypothetical protein